jgi:glycolate oxidase iron-sulfur subunit
LKHSIDQETVGPFAEPMASAIEACVHCGFCLPACPTYNVLGQEADSPRGRIVLMKQVLEGELDEQDIAPHIDRCLGCLACESACPSGVPYRDLISPFRSRNSVKKSFLVRLRDKLISLTLPFPGRFRWALRLASCSRFLAFLLPGPFRPMAELVPKKIPSYQPLKDRYPAKGEKRCKVALLAGCAQQVLAPKINQFTIELLTEYGVEVVVPGNQSCCGALDWHNGGLKQARKLAENNLSVFPADVDWIVTNAAGCGSGMKEYGVLFEGTDHQSEAKKIADKTIDVSVLLSQLDFSKRAVGRPQPKTLRVAYHDACHLSHGQHVRSQPRALLQSIPGIELLGINNTEMCCGSAGTFNIDQPEIANQLGQSKAQAIADSGAEFLVTGNIGCIVQIQNHLQKLGSPIKVMHLVEFLSRHSSLA